MLFLIFRHHKTLQNFNQVVQKNHLKVAVQNKEVNAQWNIDLIFQVPYLPFKNSRQVFQKIEISESAGIFF